MLNGMYQLMEEPMRDHSPNTSIPTWQRVSGWIIIAGGVYGLLLVVLDGVMGMPHRNDAVKQAALALGSLALGTSHLLTPRRRRAILSLSVTALLLFAVSFVIPFSPR